MKISIRIVSALLLTAGLWGSAFAQQERDMIEVLRSQIAADRQAVVAANLNIPEDMSRKFWPLYREYHDRRDALMDRRVALLTKFRDNYVGLTAKQADEILKEAMRLENDLLKLKKKYLKKFRKVLTARSTLRYFQIENKLDAVVNYSIAEVVPLSN